jgi:nucleoside 2-deoxyribosyltransferase
VSRRPVLYLAGPEGFLPNGQDIGARKKSLCAAYGCEGLFPFDNGLPEGPCPDRLIYAANLRMIHLADAGIFNLTPFRGPSADPGTVFELGLMTGLGKPVFGYTSTKTDLRTRIEGARQGADGMVRDAEGVLVEDFGNADNLMIDACLAANGHCLIRHDGAGRLDDLHGFEACLRLACSEIMSP